MIKRSLIVNSVSPSHCHRILVLVVKKSEMRVDGRASSKSDLDINDDANKKKNTKIEKHRKNCRKSDGPRGDNAI